MNKFLNFQNHQVKSPKILIIIGATFFILLFINLSFGLAVQASSPQIELIGPVDDVEFGTSGPVNFQVNATDSDGDILRTNILLSPTVEGLNDNIVCNAYGTGSNSIDCDINGLPLGEDTDQVIYYKFDDDFSHSENYELGGYDLPFNTEPIGCYKIYNYAGSDYDLTTTPLEDSDQTRSTATQDCNLNYNRKWVSGLVNQALSFDGANDYIEVPDSNNLDLTGQFSVDFWFWPFNKDTTQLDQLFRKNRDQGGAAAYEMYYADPTYFCVTDINGTEKCVSFDDDIFSVQQWNHVVALLDGTYLKVYVNGGQAGSSVAVASSQVAQSSKNLMIGNYYSNGLKNARPFKGKIDEFHIYNRALTESEIQQSFSDGSNSLASTVSTEGQVLYLTLDHQIGDTAEDSSGQGNHGQLYNYRYIRYGAGEGKYGGALDFLGASSGIGWEQINWVNGWYGNPAWDEGGSQDLTDDITLSVWIKPYGQDPYSYTDGHNNIIINRRFSKTPVADAFDFGFLDYSDEDIRLYFRIYNESCQHAGTETMLGDFIAFCNGGPHNGERCDGQESGWCGEGYNCIRLQADYQAETGLSGFFAFCRGGSRNGQRCDDQASGWCGADSGCVQAAPDQDEWISASGANIMNAADLNQWHHVAASYHYNEQTSKGELYIYLDGQPVAKNLLAIGPLCNYHMPIQVGGEWYRNWVYPSVPFNGMLDEVAIYKRAMTAQEIANIYNGGFTERCYYWKAQANDGTETVESETRQFCFNQAPTLISAETDRDEYHSGQTVNFLAEWSDSEGSTVKAVVADNTDFTDCDYNTNTGCLAYSSATQTSPAIASMTASADLTWYLRVCDSFNACSNYLSDSFTITPNSPPILTGLEAPIDSICLNTTDLIFDAKIADSDPGDEIYGFFNIIPQGDAPSNTGTGVGSSVAVIPDHPSAGETYCMESNGCLDGLGEGRYLWSAKAVDSYGGESEYADYWTLDVDLGEPAGSISLAGGATTTTNQTVILSLNIIDELHQDRLEIRVRGDVNPDDASYYLWQDYTTSLSLLLSNGYGAKTVYVDARDGCGNVITLSDSITYTKASNNNPGVTLISPPNHSNVATKPVSLVESVSDVDSDPLGVEVYCSSDPDYLDQSLICRSEDVTSGQQLSCAFDPDQATADEDIVYWLKFDNDSAKGEDYPDEYTPSLDKSISQFAVYDYGPHHATTYVPENSSQVQRKWVAGLIDKALSFDGYNDYVSVADSSSLDFTSGGLTVEVWVNTTGWGDGDVGLIRKKWAADKNTFMLYRDRSGSIGMLMDADEGSFFAGFSSSLIPANQWHHLAASFGNSEIKTYLDGHLMSVTPADLTVKNGDYDIEIGAWASGPIAYSAPFSGLMDDLRISQRTRSDTEILGDYYDGLIGVANLNTYWNTVVYLTFDETSGDIAHDESIEEYHNDGTLHNYRFLRSAPTEGRFGGALDFWGYAEGITVGDWVQTDWDDDWSDELTGPLTVAAWVKLPEGEFEGPAPVINRRFVEATWTPGIGARAFDFGFISGNRLYFRIMIPPNCRSSTETFLGDFLEGDYDEYVGGNTNAIDDTNWHYVVGTYEGVADYSSILKLYIDGELVAQNTHARGPEICGLYGQWNKIQVGAYQALYWLYSSQNFEGLIDEAMIYKRRLTAEEVADNYRLDRGRYYWQAKVNDGFSTTTSESWDFTFDNAPGLPVIIEPDDGVCFNTTNIVLAATISDLDIGDAIYGFYNVIAEGEAPVNEGTGVGTRVAITAQQHEGVTTCNAANNCLVLPEAAEGTYYWQVEAIDDLGVEGPAADLYSFDIDQSAPTNYSVVIEDGAASTADRTVSLDLTVQDVHTDTLEVNITGDLSGIYIDDELVAESVGQWISYTPNFEVMLTDGYGIKEVQVLFRDGCGNQATNPATDDIVYASTSSALSAPEVSIISPKDDIHLAGDDSTYNDITFVWQFKDDDQGDYQSAFKIKIYNTDSELIYITDWVSGEENSVNLENLPLVVDTNYFWQIKVKDSSSLESSWSDLESFYTNARPTVMIISPKDDVHLTGSDSTYNNITFTWQFGDSDPASRQAAYKIELYDQDKKFIYETEWTEGTKITATIEDLPLATGTQYYWSLTVEDEYGLDGESELESFYTNARPYGLEIFVPGDEGELDVGGPKIIFSPAIDPDNHNIFYQIAIKNSIESEYEILLNWSQAEDYRSGDRYIFTSFSYEFYDGDYTIKICPQDEYGLTGDCAFSGFTLAFGHYNRWPIAIAHWAATINPDLIQVGDEVKFDGTDSYDPDGDEITYHWIIQEKPAGSSTNFDDDTLSQPSLSIDAPGFYAIILEVTDNHEPPAKSMRGLNCNYNDWLCFNVAQLGMIEYCGDGILQLDEQCEKVYLEGQWQVISDWPECGWSNCQKCLCSQGLNPPAWQEVMPR